MYKILNDLSALQLSNYFVKLNDININYNLRNMETDLALPRPALSIVVECFGTIFPTRQRPHSRFRILNTNLPPRLPCLLLDRAVSMYITFILNA